MAQPSAQSSSTNSKRTPVARDVEDAEGTDNTPSKDSYGAKDMLVERLNQFTDKIRALTPEGGPLSSTSETLTAKIDDLCTYIENHSPKEMVYSVGAVMRGRPLPFLLGAAGVALGLILSSAPTDSTGVKTKGSKNNPKDFH